MIGVAALIVVLWLLSLSISIGGDNERFAIFRHGRFAEFQCGIVVVLPFVARVHCITLGDVGIFLRDNLARFGDDEVPVRSATQMESGQLIQVTGFADDQQPEVIPWSAPRRR